MKIIGIVGSRKRNSHTDEVALRQKFSLLYEEGDWICSGGCYAGADKFAETMAREKGIPILIFHANWNRHGKAAGPIRNAEIAKKSDVLIALLANDSSGTLDTIKKWKAINYNKEPIIL